MFRFFKVILFTCLIGISIAKPNTIVCSREPADILLSSQPLFQVSVLHEPKIKKSFEGYRITCVEANLPLGLKRVLSLSILEGGVGCDFVGLQFRVKKILTIGIGLKIYGVKANANDLKDLSCRAQDDDNSDEGLLGIS